MSVKSRRRAKKARKKKTCHRCRKQRRGLKRLYMACSYWANTRDLAPRAWTEIRLCESCRTITVSTLLLSGYTETRTGHFVPSRDYRLREIP